MPSQCGQSPSIMVSMVLGLLRQRVSGPFCWNSCKTYREYPRFYHRISAIATVSQNPVAEIKNILMACRGKGRGDG